ERAVSIPISFHHALPAGVGRDCVRLLFHLQRLLHVHDLSSFTFPRLDRFRNRDTPLLALEFESSRLAPLGPYNPSGLAGRGVNILMGPKAKDDPTSATKQGRGVFIAGYIKSHFLLPVG